MKKLYFLLFSVNLFFGISMTAIASNAVLPNTTAALPKYTAQIPVPDESHSERDKAFPAALKQVLVNISGWPEIVNTPALQKPLADAATIVTSYSYVKGLDADKSNQPILSLRVKFDPDSVEQILELAPPPPVQLETNADTPIQQDNAASAANTNTEIANNKSTEFNNHDQQNLNPEPSPVILKVSGIDQLNQQLELIKYLQNFNIISDVKLENVSGDTVLLSMQVKGGQNALINTLNNQNKLMIINGELDPANQNNILNYHWINN